LVRSRKAFPNHARSTVSLTARNEAVYLGGKQSEKKKGVRFRQKREGRRSSYVVGILKKTVPGGRRHLSR